MRQRLHPSIFCLILKKISIDNTPKRVYNINMGGKRKISAKHWKGEKGNGKETKEKVYQVARLGHQCTGRLNHRNNLNRDR